MLILLLVSHFSCVFGAAGAAGPQQSVRRAELAVVSLSPQDIRTIEGIIGYSFKNQTWLAHAFCHNSLASVGESGFQQLEFLGDRVIAAILSDYDFSVTARPETLHEQLKAKTNNPYLARCFKAMGLARFLKTNPGSSIDTIAADAFEALVGAIQKDSEESAGVLSAETIDFVLLHLNGIKKPVRMHQVTVSVTKSSGEVLSETGEAQNPKTAKLNAVKKLWPRLFVTEGVPSSQMTWQPFADGCKKAGYRFHYDTTSVEAHRGSSVPVVMTAGLRQKEFQPSFSYPAEDGRGIIFVHEGREYLLPLRGNHGAPPLEGDFTDQHIAGMSESRLRQTIDRLKEDRERVACHVVKSINRNPCRPGELWFDQEFLFRWNKQEVAIAEAILARLDAALAKRVGDRDSTQDIRYPAAIGYGEILIRGGRRYFLKSREDHDGDMPPTVLDFTDDKIAGMTEDRLYQTIERLQSKLERAFPFGPSSCTAVENRRDDKIRRDVGIGLPWNQAEITTAKLGLIRLKQELSKREADREQEERRQRLIQQRLRQQREARAEQAMEERQRTIVQQPKGWCTQS